MPISGIDIYEDEWGNVAVAKSSPVGEVTSGNQRSSGGISPALSWVALVILFVVFRVIYDMSELSE